MIKEKYFMNMALHEAYKAYKEDEVPIGCIIVYKNKIIGRGYNKRTQYKNVLYHAEIIAIYDACKYLNDWRLEDCTIYVTVEPCPMCGGAIIQSRIKKLVYGSKSIKSGAVGTKINLFKKGIFNHNVEVIEGVLEEESNILMKSFFNNIRK